MSDNRLGGKSLAGQTAIVTGSSSGIGAGIARQFGESGINVVVNYAGNRQGAEEVVRQVTEFGGNAIAVQADVSHEEDVAAMFRMAVEYYGTVDIMVSNAGIQKDAPFVDMTFDQWNRVISVNLTGAFLCAREAAREFLRRGMVPERSRALGKIIFISSVHEIIPWGGHVNYAASKGGLMLLMKSIAQELGPNKIRVNSIAPGAVKTPINRSAWETPEAEADLLQLIPYERVGEPVDIARAALWLASDEADYVHGTSLLVDGGMSLYPGFTAGG
ncbi:MAG: SDR family oxidoreductase [Desulfobulbaceae bacterium]|nr:SDR family oxidoreductase [Desulfobulbaceae bacterium]